MNANAAMAVNPAIPPAPSRNGGAAESRMSTSERGQFDRKLDAARRRHEDDRQQSARDDSQATAAPAKASKPAAKTTTAKHADDKPADDTADAGALTAAMLALLGRAAPAIPKTTAVAAGGLAGRHAPVAATAGKPGAPLALADALGAATFSPTVAAASAAIDTSLQPATQALGAAAAPTHEHGAAELQQLAMQAASLTVPNNTATPTAAHALSISSPVGSPTFAQELGQQVAWLGGQDLKQARIRLHPEELGQLDVKLSVTHNQVDVTFAVQHPAAVHAVQQTLAQLDTLLAQHGLSLGHAEVGQQQSRNDGQRGGSGGVAAIDTDGESFAAQPQVVPNAIGLLDTFA